MSMDTEFLFNPCNLVQLKATGQNQVIYTCSFISVYNSPSIVVEL